PPQTFPSPFDFTFTIDPIRFQGNAVIAMLAVPLAIAALMAFFRYTNVGLAIRASADSADRAALLGVPVKRIQTVVWVVATVLATMAIILRAGVIGLPLGSVLGPRILLRALTAGVIGRMERLPTIFVAAVGIGVIEQSIIWSTGRNLLIDPVLFLVVIGALLLQRRGRTSRVDDSESSSWQSAQVVRETPRELMGIPEVVWARRGLVTLLLGALVLLPAWMPGSRVNLVASMFIYGMLGISLVVLTGWAGQVSLGQVGFFAIGAAVAGYLTATRHWDLSIAAVAAGLAGAAAAIAIGLPALRIRGLFLAVTTLAFALATSSWFLNPEFVHWLPTGRIERPALFGRVAIHTEVRYYYLCLASLIVITWAVRGVRTSRTGRVLIGVRENERGAQAYGVNAIAAKLTGFALSGFIAAFAGGLFVHHQQALGISAYLPEESLRVFVMAVIGGLASVPGVLVGAAFIKGIHYFSAEAPRAIQPLIQLSATSIGLVFVLLVLPGGLGSVLYGLRDRYLRWVARRRGLVVPSFVADIRVEPDSVAGTTSAVPIEVPTLVTAGSGP
ncbi:MAG TPA: hypothetical protein VM030_00505, partial [Acidimicrobiales bacterium]|nr:hypothetical protein [Acidimicrobiales bacterium]